jgi:hypothetical protein
LRWTLLRPVGLRYPAWLIVCIPLAVAAITDALQARRGARWWSFGAGATIILAALVYLSPEGARFGQQPFATLGDVILGLARFRSQIPASLVLLVMTALLVLRGMSVDWMSHEELWSAFLFGILALGVLMLLPADVTGSLALGNAMAAFLLWGLLALALLSVASMLNAQRTLGKKAPTLSRYWLLVVSLAVGVVILVGWGLGIFFSPETVAEIMRWLNPIRQAVGRVLSWVVGAFLYLIFLVLEPLINWLRSLIAKREMPKIEIAKQFADQLRELQEEAPAQTASIPWGAIAAVIVGIVVIVALLLAWRRRKRARQGAGIDEQREYIGSVDLILNQLRDLLNIRRHRRTSPFLDALHADDPRHQIRLLYRRLLTAARASEQPRLPGQTPASFARRLARLLPAREDDLRDLTTAYHQARYASEAPLPGVLSQVEQATARIEEALK